MDIQPKNQIVRLNFYKPTGKWYASGKAVVNHFIFQEGFKQDIVDTQSTLRDGWQGEFYVQTSCPEEVNGFFECLFHPEEFKGIKLQKKKTCKEVKNV